MMRRHWMWNTDKYRYTVQWIPNSPAERRKLAGYLAGVGMILIGLRLIVMAVWSILRLRHQEG